jgi:hypothetical protein
MDRNTELLLVKAGQLTRWEDEEKATNDVEQLREEFRRRLYGSGCAQTPLVSPNRTDGSGARSTGPCHER